LGKFIVPLKLLCSPTPMPGVITAAYWCSFVEFVTIYFITSKNYRSNN